MDRAALQALLCHAALELLQGAGQQGPGPAVVRARRGSVAVAYRFADADQAGASRAAALLLNGVSGTALYGLALRILLSPTERAVAEALLQGPVNARGLARRCGEDLGTRFRVILANLVDRRVLRLGEGGYELADPLIAELIRACPSVQR